MKNFIYGFILGLLFNNKINTDINDSDVETLIDCNKCGKDFKNCEC